MRDREYLGMDVLLNAIILNGIVSDTFQCVRIMEYREYMSDEIILKAIERTTIDMPSRLSFLISLLDSWHQQGWNTVSDMPMYEQRRKTVADLQKRKETGEDANATGFEMEKP